MIEEKLPDLNSLPAGYWHLELMKLKKRIEEIDAIISPVIATMIVSNSIFLMASFCVIVEMEATWYNLIMSILSVNICLIELLACCLIGELIPRQVEKLVNELEWRFSCTAITPRNDSVSEINGIKRSLEIIMINNLKSRINFCMFNKFNVRLSLLLSIGSVVITYTVIIIQTSL